MSSATILRQLWAQLGRQSAHTARALAAGSQRGCASDVSSGVPYETLKDDSASAATEVPAYADAVVIGGGIVGMKLWFFCQS